MNKRRVVVTGTGVITSLADSRHALHNALCAGRSALKRVELFDDPKLVSKPIVGEITDFQPATYLGECNFRPLDRTSQLLISTARLALADSGWSSATLQNETVGLVVGTTFCSLRTISGFDRRALEEGPSCASPLDFANTVINAAAGQTGIWHRLNGVNSTISSGITSSLEALAYAAGLIEDGCETAILAGGVEDICVESLLAFQRAGLIISAPSDQPDVYERAEFCSGFALAEGAALLMLEEIDAARARGATILAEIKGTGSTFDWTPARTTSEQALQTRSQCMANAIDAALEAGGIDSKQLDATSLGANGNLFNDQAESLGCARVFGDGAAVHPVTAIKSMLGENMGASGAIQALEAVSMIEDGRLPGLWCRESAARPSHFGSTSDVTRRIQPRNCLITSMGLDGHCSALVIAVPA